MYHIFMRGMVCFAVSVPRLRKKKFQFRERLGSGLTRRGSTSSLETCEIEEMNTLYFSEMFGVEYKYAKNQTPPATGTDAIDTDGLPQGRPIGLTLYFYDSKEGNRLKNREMTLEHPSITEITQWVLAIKKKLKGLFSK